jgi:hypothetical protein
MGPFPCPTRARHPDDIALERSKPELLGQKVAIG